MKTQLTKSDIKFITSLSNIVLNEVSTVGIGKKKAIDREKILNFVKRNTPIID